MQSSIDDAPYIKEACACGDTSIAVSFLCSHTYARGKLPGYPRDMETVGLMNYNSLASPVRGMISNVSLVNRTAVQVVLG